MAVKRTEVFPNYYNTLTEKEEKQVHVAETALDAILRLQGYVSIVLKCTVDSKIRNELEVRYTARDWDVNFTKAGDSKYYWIDIE